MNFFNSLWENHPTISGDDHPCSTKGKSNFENQCAIRMGECLERSGISTIHLKVRRCWFHKNTPGHILATEELAKALENTPPTGKISKPIKFIGNEGFSSISGRKGIIFLKIIMVLGTKGIILTYGMVTD